MCVTSEQVKKLIDVCASNEENVAPSERYLGSVKDWIAEYRKEQDQMDGLLDGRYKVHMLICSATEHQRRIEHLEATVETLQKKLDSHNMNTLAHPAMRNLMPHRQHTHSVVVR